MGILDPFLNPKPLAQDHSILAREAMQMDKLSDRGGLVKKRGLVLCCDYFSGSEGQFHHWRDHQTGKRPRLPVSLSNYPEGLLLSTAAVPYTSGREDSETSSYKNLSQFRDTGLISFSGFWTHAGSAGDTEGSREVSFSSIQFGFDVQKWDNSTRGFFKLLYSDSSPSNDPAWFIADDGTNGTVIIPGSRGITAGENEHKWNWNYTRLTIDASANGGLGGYYECQINHKTFDLRSLGAGRGLQTPQAGSAMASYAGGFNPGVSLIRSTRYPNAIHNSAVFNKLTVTMDDERAAA